MQRRFTMKREAGTRGRCPPSRPRGPLPGMHPALMAYGLKVIARECDGESDAPPLLFVHGAGHGAWCWDEHFLDFFAEHGFNSYALSLRGHGKSGGRERLRWTSIADYVSDVERVAAELPRDPVVVGHSLGGLVVQKYLEAHEAPAAVLLAPPSVRGLLRPAVRTFLRHPWLSMQALLSGTPRRLFATPELVRRFFFSPELGEERVRGYAGTRPLSPSAPCWSWSARGRTASASEASRCWCSEGVATTSSGPRRSGASRTRTTRSGRSFRASRTT